MVQVQEDRRKYLLNYVQVLRLGNEQLASFTLLHRHPIM